MHLRAYTDCNSRGFQPTWANFLYQLLIQKVSPVTQIWIPQVSLWERELETVIQWEKKRESKRSRERESVRESERLRVRDGKSKSEKEWEWVRESERSRVRIHRNTTKFMWAYLKSWPDKPIFWASMQIEVVVGSNPTWVNFLYQLLNAFTQFWIPQVSLTREWEWKSEKKNENVSKRVIMKKWVCENERVTVKRWEWESESGGVNMIERVREWDGEIERDRVG